MVQKEDLLNPPAMISEGLGHKNTDTTLAYLKSFKNEAMDEMNKGILWLFQQRSVYDVVAIP